MGVMESTGFDAKQDRLDAMLVEIGRSESLVERADLAYEISMDAARLENVKADVLYPALADVTNAAGPLSRAEADQARVRQSMDAVRKLTRNVQPIDAHVHDPEGFEQAVETMIGELSSHLDQERREVLPLVVHLSGQDAKILSQAIDRAVEHASTLPDPPDNRIARVFAGAKEALDNAFGDQSTPWRPGLARLEEEQER
jgi:hypothetical protein